MRSTTSAGRLGGGSSDDRSQPDAAEVSFPAVQTYADGTVVHWDQPPLPDGGEPEHPAPMLTLAAESAPVDQPAATAAATAQVGALS